MFTSLPKTPQEFLDLSTEYFSALPKTMDEVTAVAGKVKTVLEIETANAQSVIAAYQKAAKGDASINDIALANKKAQELMVTARFAAILAMPGSIFILPAIAKAAKNFSVELYPASVKEEFSL
jgi:hypothetical protein